jgi:hypothetical protein
LKHYDTEYGVAHLRPYCPRLGSDTRWVEVLPRALLPRCGYLHTRHGRCTGLALIDSTPLAVCDHHRMTTPRVFADSAPRGQIAMGWL